MEKLIDGMLIDIAEKALGEGGKIAFFVGAGISVPSGVPDFKRLNEEVIRTLSDDMLKADDYGVLSENIRPEVMYQIATDELGSGVLRSLQMLEGYEPNHYHYLLARAIERGNWVFTTNVDNLIETACMQRGMRLGVDYKTCYGCDNDEDFKEYVGYLNSGSVPGGCIFKLHGNIEEGNEDQRYRTVRFALRQVGKGLFGPREEILEYFLKNFDFWFVGYSCRDDFSVFPVLSATKSDRDMFWFDYDEGPLRLSTLQDSRLRWEMETEENKPLDEERDLKLLNINAVLLQRKGKYKFIGDLGTFITTRVLPLFGTEVTGSSGRELKHAEGFSQWVAQKGKVEKGIFLGRLFEQVGKWDRAVQFYDAACREAKDSLQRARAKQRLADLYYRQTILGKEEEAIHLYGELVESTENPLERASLKASIANVQRRRGEAYFSDSFDKAHQAKQEFESILNEEQRKGNLDYARCLNVYGLTLYGLRRFEEARKFFLDSIEIKKALGDVDGIAESENALSLTFTQEGRRLTGQPKEESKNKFLEAINHARKAVDARRKIGNYRGYAQNCRNLAWPYSELMKLSSEEHERQSYFKEARDGYKAGISSWNRFKPPPPREIVLFSNLLAKLYFDFCHITQEREQKIKWAPEIVAIYKVMLKDPMRKEIARSDKRPPTAEQNLQRAIELLKELRLSSEAKEADAMLRDLKSG